MMTSSGSSARAARLSTSFDQLAVSAPRRAARLSASFGTPELTPVPVPIPLSDDACRLRCHINKGLGILVRTRFDRTGSA